MWANQTSGMSLVCGGGGVEYGGADVLVRSGRDSTWLTRQAHSFYLQEMNNLQWRPVHP